MELVADVYSLLRFCGALAVLLAVYYLLFDRKARFVYCRYFLLSAVVVAAFAAVARIPVYPAERVVVLVSGSPEVARLMKGQAGDTVAGGDAADEVVAAVKTGEEVAAGKTDSAAGQVIAVREQVNAGEEDRGDSGDFFRMEKEDVFLLVYGVVALLLALRWVWAMLGILRLKRWGSCFRQNGVTIVKNNRVASPFSFFRMIFINRKLEGETLQVVLEHEMCHIRHRHYIDTLLMEAVCVVCWCNPLVWWVKRELQALHEFEVDRCLLSEGLELSKYQNIIFDELMGYSPGIANGFHNSLIKKRFIMMKSANTIRYGLLRKVMLLPVLAGVVALFAFTDRGQEVDRVLLPEFTRVPELAEANFAPVAVPEFTEATLPAGTGDCPEELPDKRKKTKRPEKGVLPVEKLTVSADTGTEVLLALDADEEVRPPFKGRDGLTFYPLSNRQVVVSLLPYRPGGTVIRYIEPGKEDTRVTVAVPVIYDSHWIQFDKGFCIVDRATGDAYMLRSMTRGIELNKLYTVEGQKNRMVEFTMVFPPLKRGVKFIDIYQKFPDMQARTPSNGSPWTWKGLNVDAYAAPKDKDSYYDREGRPRTPRKVQYVDLRDDQVVVSNLPSVRETKLRAIVTSDKETRVTVAVPIYFDRHWVQFDKGYCIEDCRTGEVYRVQSMDRGIEMNKTSVVVGKKGKVVEFTMIFPPLKKKVKRVNLYTKYPEEGGLAPTNAAGDWVWRNIRLADYALVRGNVYY